MSEPKDNATRKDTGEACGAKLRAVERVASGILEIMKRTAHVVTGHDQARKADLAKWAAMTPEERMKLGAELHAFWVRNYYPNADRLDRTLRIVQRPRR